VKGQHTRFFAAATFSAFSLSSFSPMAPDGFGCFGKSTAEGIKSPVGTCQHTIVNVEGHLRTDHSAKPSHVLT